MVVSIRSLFTNRAAKNILAPTYACPLVGLVQNTFLDMESGQMLSKSNTTCLLMFCFIVAFNCTLKSLITTILNQFWIKKLDYSKLSEIIMAHKNEYVWFLHKSFELLFCRKGSGSVYISYC